MKSNINKCCVCGSATNELTTCASTLSETIKTYCTNCIISGFEPYNDLVDFGWEYKRFNKTYQQKVIIPTLKLNNKTIEQFNADVMKNFEQATLTENISSEGQETNV